MTPDEYLARLRADIGEMRTLAERAIIETPVAACPDWDVGDLLMHAAGVYRFATAQLRAAPGSEIAPFDPPGDGPSAEELAEAAEGLLAALEETDPTEHRPNWHGDPTAAFWFRRMTQETIVHRADLEIAVDGHASAIDPAMACDGVDELADVFLTHAKRRGITGAGETVHLHATDDGLAEGTGEWLFTFTDEGVTTERVHAKGDMAVRGPACDLLLFVWNRRPVAVECFGEPDALLWWLDRVRI